MSTRFSKATTVAKLGAITALLTLAVPASSQSGRVTAHHLQWSRSATISAPNNSATVEVIPHLDQEENDTQVLVKNSDNGETTQLFTLTRAADLYWSADSTRILVVNQQLSGTNTLLLFNLRQQPRENKRGPANKINTVVQRAIAGKVGENSHLQFYLPKLSLWTGSRLLFAVGGQFYRDDESKLVTYCYGVFVNTDPLQVKQTISRKELQRATGHTCQVSP